MKLSITLPDGTIVRIEGVPERTTGATVHPEVSHQPGGAAVAGQNER